MSFQNFSNYRFAFNRLDSKLASPDAQKGIIISGCKNTQQFLRVKRRYQLQSNGIYDVEKLCVRFFHLQLFL